MITHHEALVEPMDIPINAGTTVKKLNLKQEVPNNLSSLLISVVDCRTLLILEAFPSIKYLEFPFFMGQECNLHQI